MTATAAGVLLGLSLGAGALLLALSAPPVRPVRLDQRLAPYLRDAPRPSRLLVAEPRAGSSFVLALRKMLGPLLVEAVRRVDRVIGGRGAVRRRLAALGSAQTVDEFRLEQVVWGGVGLAAGVAGSGLLAVAAGGFQPLSTLLLAGCGAVGGVLGRDWWLTQQVQRRHRAILTEFPVVAELLALAVTAGEGATGAIERVCRLTGGELTRDLSGAMGRSRAGVPLVGALAELRDRTGLDPLARFLDGMIIAIERGTPLADVLRAQAADIREAGKRALLEAGGRKEILMLVPVVFLLLPVTVLFALFPGLINITELVR
ncbi:MAG: tight adherence protein [Mycobacteriales bacterium]